MKQCFYFILFICLILFLVIIPRNAISQVYKQERSLEPRVVIKGKVIESPKTSFKTYCYEIHTLEIVPCHFKIKIDKAHEENDCQGAANTPCGHIDSEHTPSRSALLTSTNADKTRVLGGLTDAQQSNMTTELDERKEQLVYSYDYYSGEISGKITLKSVATLSDSLFGSFIPPCEAGGRVKASYRDINVEHCGGKYSCERFVELPEPLPPNESNIYWSDGYVRCGLGSACSIPDVFNPADWLAYDKPYNWPAHPTVHWGKWDFNFELIRLAKKWYEVFGRPLVINDISLPKGGLLDVAKDWTAKMGHSSHRKGVDADILGISVISAVRPSGPKDKRWRRLYEEYGLLENLRLTYVEEDYNHLKFAGGSKTK